MTTFARTLLVFLMILAIGFSGRVSEIGESGASDGYVISLTAPADADHGPTDSDGTQVKNTCHGAIGCHVLFTASPLEQVYFDNGPELYFSRLSGALGGVSSDHLRPPISA